MQVLSLKMTEKTVFIYESQSKSFALKVTKQSYRKLINGCVIKNDFKRYSLSLYIRTFRAA